MSEKVVKLFDVAKDINFPAESQLISGNIYLTFAGIRVAFHNNTVHIDLDCEGKDTRGKTVSIQPYIEGGLLLQVTTQVSPLDEVEDEEDE